jgi:hypothetical protein
VGMERFANAGRNGHFQHPHLIVLEEKLVMLWRRGESVVLGCPPPIEVPCTLSEQESRASRRSGFENRFRLHGSNCCCMRGATGRSGA